MTIRTTMHSIIFSLVLCLCTYFKVTEQGSCDQSSFLGLCYVNEGQPVGTVIYNYLVFTNSSDITSVDTNFPNEMTFNMGTMQLIAMVSFDSQVKSFYALSLAMSCGSAKAIYTQTIVVMDINNHAAQWTYSSSNNFYSGVINDNAAINTQVYFPFQPFFTDVDTNTSYNVLLLDPLNQNAFSTASKSKDSPVIITSKQLMNYDTRSLYNLTLYLMDLDPMTTYARFNASASVYITVNLTNSKPPVFEFGYYQFQIYNNATMNSSFAVIPTAIKAVNGDPHFSTPIYYRLTTPYNFISLDPATGVLRLVNTTAPVTFPATIVAYQSINSSIQSSISVQISILSFVNIIPVRFSQKIANISMAETYVGALVQLNVTYSQSNQLQISTSPALGNIQIPSSGLVMVTQRFYYAVQTFYNVTVTATDTYTSDQMILLIYIIDINEQQPTFSASSYYFIGNQSLSTNTFLLQVIKYDPNTSLAFNIQDSYGIFNWLNLTNYLYISILKSKTTAMVYYLIVTVTESGQPSLSNIVNVTIDFSNTNGPVFDFLPLYILLPLILLLILLIPIILCYYRKRRVFKASGSSLAPSVFNDPTDSFIRRWGRSSDLNEDVLNISNIYNSDRDVRQLPRLVSDPIIYSTFENQRNKIVGNSVYLDIVEMKELDLSTDIKAQNSLDAMQNSEKIVAL